MDKKVIHDHFSKTANVWRDQIYKPQNEQRAFEYFDKQYRFDYVTEMIPQAGDSVSHALDVGCGAGQMVPVLARKGYEVHAIDCSQDMVSLTKQEADSNNVEADVQIGDCEHLDYPDDFFDVYVAMGVIEYMDDDVPMFQEIQRVLKPGGIAIVTIRNILSIHVRWRIFYLKYINLPLKNILRRILGKTAKSFIVISKEHSPKTFINEIINIKFKILDDRYAHFYFLPAPFSQWLSPIEASVGKILEKLLSRKNIPFLASTYIVKFQK